MFKISLSLSDIPSNLFRYVKKQNKTKNTPIRLKTLQYPKSLGGLSLEDYKLYLNFQTKPIMYTDRYSGST